MQTLCFCISNSIRSKYISQLYRSLETHGYFMCGYFKYCGPARSNTRPQNYNVSPTVQEVLGIISACCLGNRL